MKGVVNLKETLLTLLKIGGVCIPYLYNLYLPYINMLSISISNERLKRFELRQVKSVHVCHSSIKSPCVSPDNFGF